jgi:hypothetical protein
MSYKVPPLPNEPFRLISLPYSSNTVWGELGALQSSLGEEIGLLYDNKSTYPAGRGINVQDLGSI